MLSQLVGKQLKNKLGYVQLRSFAGKVCAPVQAKSDKPFEKILVANRGEIACRVMQTCKKMGIKTVAVYSEPDRQAKHVKLADEAVCVGPAISAKSYLNQDNVIKACLDTGAQAVHPGYGFLSENHIFSEKLEKAGVVFIGPKNHAMSLMGDKVVSKTMAKKAGVFTIPGFLGTVGNDAEVLKVANEIGYPVMIKAAKGGGGKGMRIAWNDKEAVEGFRLSRGEAASAFGDDRILIEKYIVEPRHIEMQVMLDAYGNGVWLNERECSIQRRNQKVVEEAPSTFLTPEVRESMGNQAVALGKAVAYQSAGTVEFLVDKNRQWYFLEMNTRLQVEHPVTEYITGFDLVEMMINVAAGRKLPITQKDVKINGWAMECRVYAEDPLRGFLPSIGRLHSYQEPKGEHVRCDSGILEGQEISIYYDPLLCKLVTWGKTRDASLAVMREALDEYIIGGVTHNVNFLRSVIDHPRFIKGAINTRFIQDEFPEGYKGLILNQEDTDSLMAAALSVYARKVTSNMSMEGAMSTFDKEAFLKQSLQDLFVLQRTGDATPAHQLSVTDIVVTPESQTITMKAGERTMNIVSTYKPGDVIFTQTVNGNKAIMQLIEQGKGDKQLNTNYTLQLKGTKFNVEVRSKLQHELTKHMPIIKPLDETKFVAAPMPGAIFSLAVKEGDKVVPGQELLVIEAMKMQNVIRCSREGVVKKVNVKPAQNVARDFVMVQIE